MIRVVVSLANAVLQLALLKTNWTAVAEPGPTATWTTLKTGAESIAGRPDSGVRDLVFRLVARTKTG